MDLKILKKKYIIFIAVICFLGAMVFAENKVYAEPQEYTCVKNAEVGFLFSQMGFQKRKPFIAALGSLCVPTNGKKFTDQTKTIIFDAVEKKVKLKNKPQVYIYDVDTGRLTLITETDPSTETEVLNPYKTLPKEYLQEQLFKAIKKKDISKVQQILATNKININEPLCDGYTPLQIAVSFGRLDIVKYLLTIPGININDKGCVGITPLFKAVKEKNTDIVEAILNSEGVAIDDPHDKDGSTPLFIAVQNEDQNTVKLLMEKGADANNVCKQGYSPLHLAVQKKCPDIVQIILDYEGRVDINRPTNSSYGTTPLYIAASNGDIKSLQLLLDKGADPNIPNNQGEFPLDCAIDIEDLPIVNVLLDNRAGINTQHPTTGFTPLLRAICMNKSDEIALRLIERGADITLKNSIGCTPFFVAAKNEKIDLLKILHEKDGNTINEPNDQNFTPLNFAAQHNLLKTLDCLTSLDANPNIPDNEGFTPLFRAVVRNHYEFAKILVEKYKDIIALDASALGSTPLIFAVDKKRNELAQLLIDAGSNVNGIVEIDQEEEARKNNLAETPLRVAIRSQNAPMIIPILCHENFNFTYDYMGNAIELLQAIGVGDCNVIEALLGSEKIHITASILDFTSDEGIKALLRRKLEPLKPAEEEEGPEQESGEEEKEEEEPELEDAPQDVQLPQPNPLLDQAERPLAPTSPIRIPRPVDDNPLSKMIIPLEQQVADWRALNSLLNRTAPFPLRVDIHTMSAVKPIRYIQAVFNRLCGLLEDGGYPDVEVILITGRGNHSRQRGFSKLKNAVLTIARENHFGAQESSDPGRLSLKVTNYHFV
ncbi:MAG: ankyrin repeat domain-containing protein [Lactobacillales bacterium]|jgi:ankyrin repeat protein|nr:ankyrin repeat domain-containing protein [Lactobacillales bacterium]